MGDIMIHFEYDISSIALKDVGDVIFYGLNKIFSTLAY